LHINKALDVCFQEKKRNRFWAILLTHWPLIVKHLPNPSKLRKWSCEYQCWGSGWLKFKFLARKFLY
jgi:hypothetical protein